MKYLLILCFASAIFACNTSDDQRSECPNCTQAKAREWVEDSCRDANGNATSPCDSTRGVTYYNDCCVPK